MEGPLFNISNAANFLGISKATMNYYTDLGLFQVAERVGKKRLYHKDDILNQYGKIKKLKEEGYPLNIITQKLSRKK